MVENDKEDGVVEKEELIMKNEKENKEILRERKNTKKISLQHECELGKAIQVNNELKLSVDEQ